MEHQYISMQMCVYIYTYIYIWANVPPAPRVGRPRSLVQLPILSLIDVLVIQQQQYQWTFTQKVYSVMISLVIVMVLRTAAVIVHNMICTIQYCIDSILDSKTFVSLVILVIVGVFGSKTFVLLVLLVLFECFWSKTICLACSACFLRFPGTFLCKYYLKHILVESSQKLPKKYVILYNIFLQYYTVLYSIISYSMVLQYYIVPYSAIQHSIYIEREMERSISYISYIELYSSIQLYIELYKLYGSTQLYIEFYIELYSSIQLYTELYELYSLYKLYRALYSSIQLYIELRAIQSYRAPHSLHSLQSLYSYTYRAMQSYRALYSLYRLQSLYSSTQSYIELQSSIQSSIQSYIELQSSIQKSIQSYVELQRALYFFSQETLRESMRIRKGKKTHALNRERNRGPDDRKRPQTTRKPHKNRQNTQASGQRRPTERAATGPHRPDRQRAMSVILINLTEKTQQWKQLDRQTRRQQGGRPNKRPEETSRQTQETRREEAQETGAGTRQDDQGDRASQHRRPHCLAAQSLCSNQPAVANSDSITTVQSEQIQIRQQQDRQRQTGAESGQPDLHVSALDGDINFFRLGIIKFLMVPPDQWNFTMFKDWTESTRFGYIHFQRQPQQRSRRQAERQDTDQDRRERTDGQTKNRGCKKSEFAKTKTHYQHQSHKKLERIIRARWFEGASPRCSKAKGGLRTAMESRTQEQRFSSCARPGAQQDREHQKIKAARPRKRTLTPTPSAREDEGKAEPRKKPDKKEARDDRRQKKDTEPERQSPKRPQPPSRANQTNQTGSQKKQSLRGDARPLLTASVCKDRQTPNRETARLGERHFIPDVG